MSLIVNALCKSNCHSRWLNRKYIKKSLLSLLENSWVSKVWRLILWYKWCQIIISSIHTAELAGITYKDSKVSISWLRTIVDTHINRIFAALNVGFTIITERLNFKSRCIWNLLLLTFNVETRNFGVTHWNNIEEVIVVNLTTIVLQINWFVNITVTNMVTCDNVFSNSFRKSVNYMSSCLNSLNIFSWSTIRVSLSFNCFDFIACVTLIISNFIAVTCCCFCYLVTVPFTEFTWTRSSFNTVVIHIILKKVTVCLIPSRDSVFTGDVYCCISSIFIILCYNIICIKCVWLIIWIFIIEVDTVNCFFTA